MRVLGRRYRVRWIRDWRELLNQNTDGSIDKWCWLRFCLYASLLLWILYVYVENSKDFVVKDIPTVKQKLSSTPREYDSLGPMIECNTSFDAWLLRRSLSPQEIYHQGCKFYMLHGRWSRLSEVLMCMMVFATFICPAFLFLLLRDGGFNRTVTEMAPEPFYKLIVWAYFAMLGLTALSLVCFNCIVTQHLQHVTPYHCLPYFGDGTKHVWDPIFNYELELKDHATQSFALHIIDNCNHTRINEWTKTLEVDVRISEEMIERFKSHQAQLQNDYIAFVYISLTCFVGVFLPVKIQRILPTDIAENPPRDCWLTQTIAQCTGVANDEAKEIMSYCDVVTCCAGS